MSRPRRCYWLDETCIAPDGTGYIPSIVVEGEAGHSPLKGDPAKFQSPWIWGPTIEDAKRQVVEANAEMGIDEQAALEIVASSMFSKEQA